MSLSQHINPTSISSINNRIDELQEEKIGKRRYETREIGSEISMLIELRDGKEISDKFQNLKNKLTELDQLVNKEHYNYNLEIDWPLLYLIGEMKNIMKQHQPFNTPFMDDILFRINGYTPVCNPYLRELIEEVIRLYKDWI